SVLLRQRHSAPPLGARDSDFLPIIIALPLSDVPTPTPATALPARQPFRRPRPPVFEADAANVHATNVTRHHQTMSDDSPPRAPPPTLPNMTNTTTVKSPPPPPPNGHAIRRANTIDESYRRPRSSVTSAAATASGPYDVPRRRDSTLSDYSLGDAGDLFNPKPLRHQPSAEDGSKWTHLPIAFALLPAVGGILFQNGSAIVTDVMLLGLSAVFLHWSVTQPWNWYHSAQEVRIHEELSSSLAVDDESDPDPTSETEPADASSAEAKPDIKRRTATDATSDALAELYLHEVLALASCFFFPILGAYLLHTIRAQLSRPSEGLVSNYNLSIFLLAAELRPMSHMIRLVQSRTLRLQRYVHENPYSQVAANSTHMATLQERIEALEARPASAAATTAGTSQKQQQNGAAEQKQQAALLRDVRNAIQPELDALNRAVRRYEKKATVLAMQTESRFAMLDARLGDAIALAAAAAKNSAAQPSLLRWLTESTWSLCMLPFRALTSVLLLPFRTLLGLLKRQKRAPDKTARSARSVRPSSGQSRSGSDRPLSRLSRR
ncbi:hypothetical protein BN1708_005167, partial [Verticillium longisporum]